MKKTFLKTMLLVVCIMALSCERIGSTNPLEGTIWTTSIVTYQTDEIVDYFLEFSGNTVRYWSTENPNSASGKYTVLGTTITFKDFSVKFRSDEPYLRTVESGSFSGESLTLVFKKNYGTTLHFVKK